MEQDSPVFMLPPPKVGEVERTIARNVASLIEDGSTLQMGIGGIPDTVLSFLTDMTLLAQAAVPASNAAASATIFNGMFFMFRVPS